MLADSRLSLHWVLSVALGDDDIWLGSYQLDVLVLPRHERGIPKELMLFKLGQEETFAPDLIVARTWGAHLTFWVRDYDFTQ